MHSLTSSSGSICKGFAPPLRFFRRKTRASRAIDAWRLAATTHLARSLSVTACGVPCKADPSAQTRARCNRPFGELNIRTSVTLHVCLHLEFRSCLYCQSCISRVTSGGHPEVSSLGSHAGMLSVVWLLHCLLMFLAACLPFLSRAFTSLPCVWYVAFVNLSYLAR